jgi:hypothetical protein
MNVSPVFSASVSSTPGPLLLQDDHAELGGSFKRSVILTDDKEAGYAGACHRAAPCADPLG